ncbi:hypothetical protein AMTRI_Chr04g250060 [Amborella trichopoda]
MVRQVFFSHLSYAVILCYFNNWILFVSNDFIFICYRQFNWVLQYFLLDFWYVWEMTQNSCYVYALIYHYISVCTLIYAYISMQSACTLIYHCKCALNSSFYVI